jgi:prepilin-type N-terminal cleavage/methylation domain-containing protein
MTSNRGFTLIEVLVVSGIMAFMLASVAAMSISTMRCYDSATSRTFTDSDAATAMQMIVSDVREAKSVKIIGGGTRLRIVFPKKADGQEYYNRYEADTAHQIDYYISDSTGTPGHDGTWLWRGKDNDRRAMMRSVESVAFETDTSRSVKITVVAQQQTSTGIKRTELTQRVVYLRNY